MADFTWTDAQSAAIKARGDILVSAAAGSGKTAVLVQRVMEMIESECDIDELLVVTFTRSAAAQMKEKIAKAIDEKLKQNPYDKRFRRQQVLLEKAQITTIDAFCADVLKNHFQLLENIDISLSYKNLDAAEFAVLSREVLDEVLDEFYDSGEESFRALMDVFTSGKNDMNIYAIIDSLHAYTGAFVDKHAWLHSKIEWYRETSVPASAWGKLLLSVMAEYLQLAQDYFHHALAIVAEDAPTDAVYGENLREDIAACDLVAAAVQKGDWDTLCAYKGYKFPRYSSVKKGIDEQLRADAKPFRDAAIKAFNKAMDNVIESQEGFQQDNALIYPVACELERLFERYEQKLFERKVERQCFEFSDISDLTLKILLDKNGNPTPAAREYQNKYKGILIDEYQDTNDVQDTIFKTIENNNLFVVGDVKQSIYRFRQAMPEIFIKRRKSLQPYEAGAASGYIYLKNNFRSDKPITDYVNFLFKNIMSEAVGDTEYTQDEYLIPAARQADAATEPVELHVLDKVQTEERGKMKASYYESRYIAELIRDEVRSGKTIVEEGARRASGYSDYCVLVRSKTHLRELEQAFADVGVPCQCVAGENLFDTSEITLVMSFLRAIDNPQRDVDLIAVMYSEIFGFTADELALIRAAQRKGTFYSAVHAFAQSGNQKCAAFIQALEAYRTLAATHEPAEFLYRLYRQTSLPEIISAGENGAVKKANLFEFIRVVKMYSDSGYYGLTGLVRFLEKVKANHPDIASAVVPESESKVKIMTVHASKGLEFPVVIFAFTNRLNNHYGTNIVLNREYGIGIKPKYPDENARYSTVSYSAVTLANLRSDMAEEIRTLYVALTRPKNRLIITGTFEGKVSKAGTTKREDALYNIALLSTGTGGKIRQGWMRSNNNYLYWICACMFQHPGARVLRETQDFSEFFIDTSESGKVKVVLPDYYPKDTLVHKSDRTAAADEAIKQQIAQQFSFRYRYAGAEEIESKKTPSAVAESDGVDLEYAFEPPAFMRGDTLTAAGRGTATHRFMEKVRDFEHFDFERELAYMRQKGFLSEQQEKVIDSKSICAFFESNLAKRMAHADTLVREYAIAYLEDAGFFYPDLPARLQKEQVFVDGMIDAAFTEGDYAHIVDYKTDRVHSADELKKRYGKQMLLYKRAIERVWGKEVKQCHIYSFCLGEDIIVDFDK